MLLLADFPVTFQDREGNKERYRGTNSTRELKQQQITLTQGKPLQMQSNQMSWMWQMQQASGSATSFCKTPDRAHENMLLTQAKCTKRHTAAIKMNIYTHFLPETTGKCIQVLKHSQMMLEL